jgi:hypothetical protein
MGIGFLAGEVNARCSPDDRVRHARPPPDQGGPNAPEDIVGRLDFAFHTDPVDATLKALSL